MATKSKKIKNTIKMTYHFIHNDVKLGNYDVMMDFQNPLGLCSMRIFPVMKVIYLDIKNVTIIVSIPFCKLTINIASLVFIKHSDTKISSL